MRLASMAAPAVVLGLAAAVVAVGVWALGGAGVTALDWWLYDRWLRARLVAPASPALVVIVRDPASAARFGTGSWDRAVIARAIAGVARAGATAIGVDIPLGLPTAPERGGAVGEALLAEATAMAGTVIYPVALGHGTPSVSGSGDWPEPVDPSSPWPLPPRPGWLEAAPLTPRLPGLAEQARGLGHILAAPDRDGLLRRVPAVVRVRNRTVPAFGLALAAMATGGGLDAVSLDGRRLVLPRAAQGGSGGVSIDSHGRLLVGFAGPDLPRGARVVAFSELWNAIESRQAEPLSELLEERLVLMLIEPPRALYATPVGPMSDAAIQAHLANAVLTGDTLRETPFGWAMVQTVVSAALAAWFCLTLPWWAAASGILALTVTQLAAVPAALTSVGVVLPLGLPVTASALAAATGLGLAHLLSMYRLRRLEHENARVRETLVRHESAVESLEDDLEEARVAVARSTDAQRDLADVAEALRVQLGEARAREHASRRQLAQLEEELRGLRPAVVETEPTDAAVARLAEECAALGIITRDPVTLSRFADLQRAARGSLPILLQGEPGTGKELFARAAHRLSSRAAQPFVAVNMAAIPTELFESVMFGHVRGSFTGAVGDRKGHFAEAHGGTLFLDEVGELHLPHQGKLLRVLQDRTFHPVGASRATVVDVRIVAASNRDLDRGVAEGWFREDLYFRLKGLVLRLPPLRERPADVPLLAARILSALASEAGRSGLTLTEEAVARLRAHDWPGNVRELDNVLRQAVALTDGPLITAGDLRLPPGGRTIVRGSSVEPETQPGSDAAVLTSLRQHRFDMQATGRALGWDRSTVTQRLKGLGFRALVECAGDRGKAALALAGDPALARTVELKLREYHEHLLRAIEGFDTPDAAVAACRRRFKNLPDRHFRFLEVLVRQHFDAP